MPSDSRRATVVLVGLIAGLPACSLLDYRVEQCKVDDDCDTLAAEQPLVCRERFCRVACERHSDCEAQNACVEGGCRPLDSDNCETLAEASQGSLQDGSVLLGALLRDELTARGAAERRALILAGEELAQGESARDGRAIVLVACSVPDSNEDGDAALDRAKAHLLDTLRVPGLIVDLERHAAVGLYRELATLGKRQPLVLAIGTGVAPHPPLPSRSLLYHMGGTPQRLIEAYRAVLTSVKPYLGAELPRVALVATKEVSRSGEYPLPQQVRNSLVAAGFVASVHEIDVASGAAPSTLAKLENLRPEVLLVLSPGDQAIEVAFADKTWVPELVVFAPELEFEVVRTDKDPSAKRFVGLRWAPPRDSLRFRDFVRRLEVRFDVRLGGGEAVTVTQTAPMHYDALYLLAYAAFDAMPRRRRRLPSGVELDRSLERFVAFAPPDEPLRPDAETGPRDTGLNFVWESVNDGDADSSLLIEGASGIARFRDDGAKRAAPVSLWCRRHGSFDFGYDFDGVYVDVEDGTLDFVTETSCEALR